MYYSRPTLLYRSNSHYYLTCYPINAQLLNDKAYKLMKFLYLVVISAFRFRELVRNLRNFFIIAFNQWRAVGIIWPAKKPLQNVYKPQHGPVTSHNGNVHINGPFCM